MLVVSSTSNLGCEAGCGLAVSWSDHARIMVGSFSDRPRIGNDVSSVFKDFVRNFAILRGRRSIWRGWIVTPVAPRTVCDVSYVMRTKYVSLSA